MTKTFTVMLLIYIVLQGGDRDERTNGIHKEIFSG